MLSATRQAAILQRLKTSGEVSVPDLANSLEVSEATIRRDLNALSARGALRRVRGGGSAVEADPVPFDEVMRHSGDERSAIARAAAALVDDGAVVVLDMGTTTAALARELCGRSLTVITASLAAVRELERLDQPEVVLLGGVLRRSYKSLVGTLTTDALAALRADVCFLSMSGVRPDGSVMDDTGIEAPVKRAMIAAADRTIALATPRKFPGTGLVRVAGPEQIGTLVTTGDADQPTLEHMAACGVEVVRA